MSSLSVVRQKYYISPLGTYFFHCTECNAIRMINAEPLRRKGHVVNLRCTCGAVFLHDLEFRKDYRKKVEIPASCTAMGNDFYQQFPCSIVNISMGGVAFKLNFPYPVREGKQLHINFTLENKSSTRITRQVQVLHRPQADVFGCAFIDCGDEAMNKALSYYLK